ncbi:MAG: HEAT repeat domain-containing protein [Chloroflexi bacterium]|nr:HEAT repeat domain-containing protein [Chloroflexota bacterium]
MLLPKLIHDLRNPDPAIRIKALQILAMLEETRALRIVAEVYKNDSDQQVRQTAQWAGKVIWSAQHRGHTTEAGLQQHFKWRPPQAHAERLVENLAGQAGSDKDLQNQMDLLKSEWERLDTLTEHFQYQAASVKRLASGTDPLEMLEVGLSDDFRLLVQLKSEQP